MAETSTEIGENRHKRPNLPEFPPEGESEQDPYEHGACVRCLAPKPYPDLPDLCAVCAKEIDERLGVPHAQDQRGD